MDITFAPRGILQINDARITFKNFAGEATQYNHPGDRNFSLIIDDRDLTEDEVKSFLDIYRSAELIKREDGPVLMYNGTEIITVADALLALGWNVKIKPPRVEGESAFIHMKVNVKFNDRGPSVYLVTNGRENRLYEDTIKRLDFVEIEYIELDIRPYDWTSPRGSGRSAYLQGMVVTQKVDRFAARFAEEEYPTE